MLQRAFDPHTSKSRGTEVGRIRCVGEGLYRWGYIAWVDLKPDPEDLSGNYICLLPRDDVPANFNEQVRREAALLDALAAAGFHLRIPEVAALVPLDGRLAVVETPVEGIPLDFKNPRPFFKAPWEVVGQVAAAIHAVTAPEVLSLAGGPKTQRAHAEQCLSVFDGLEDPLLQEAAPGLMRTFPRPHHPRCFTVTCWGRTSSCPSRIPTIRPASSTGASPLSVTRPTIWQSPPVASAGPSSKRTGWPDCWTPTLIMVASRWSLHLSTSTSSAWPLTGTGSRSIQVREFIHPRRKSNASEVSSAGSNNLHDSTSVSMFLN